MFQQNVRPARSPLHSFHNELMQCSNKECTSRKGEELPMFDIQITVDAYSQPTEDLEGVPLYAFTCAYCGTEAEEKEEAQPEDRGLVINKSLHLHLGSNAQLKYLLGRVCREATSGVTVILLDK